MKIYVLVILLICTTLQAQTNFSHTTRNQLDYFNTNANDLVVESNGYSVQWQTVPNQGYSKFPPIVTDAFGNVYVSGFTNTAPNIPSRNFITIKYNSLGTVQWTKTYNGTGNGEDVVTSNTVDSYGNVYVTGYSVGIEGNWDFLTIKYSISGNQLWASRYNGSRDDQSFSIAVDNFGNVFVAGYSDTIGSSNDFTTIKYNSNGIQQWVRKYNGGYDRASDLLLDQMGNIFVTGKTSTLATGSDLTTIKYDSNGNILWIDTYNGPANRDDSDPFISIDDSGNIAITGTSWGIEGIDIVTIKYSNSGSRSWVSRYNSNSTIGDYAKGIKMDKKGNTYVIGASTINGVDFTTIKFNLLGEQQWVRKYGGAAGLDDQPSSIALDSLGNVYVTGTTIDSNYSGAIEIATIKYDSSGNQIWKDVFLQVGDEYSGQIKVNKDGSNIFVSSATYFDGLKVVKYAYTTPQPILLNPQNNSTNNQLSVNFTWKKSNLNFITYQLQVSNDSLFNYLIVNDSNIIDTSKIINGLNYSTKYYWRVIAKDTSEVEYYSSVFNFKTANGIVLNLKVSFEGIYFTLFNQLSRSEYVTVYLRNNVSPFSIVDSSESKIDSISLSGIFRFSNASAGNYYLELKHFTSIETWSKPGGEYLSILDTSLYDFSQTNSQAYGNNLKLIGDKFCLYNGDVNQDGFIDLFDVVPTYNDATNFISGNYLSTDLTGDKIVDLADVTICYNNSINFIRIRRP